METAEIFERNDNLVKGETVNNALILTKSTWIAICQLPLAERIEAVTIMADFALYGEIIESDKFYINAITSMFLPNAVAMDRRYKQSVRNGKLAEHEKKFQDEEIIKLHQKGMTNKQVADEIKCSESTVKRAIANFRLAKEEDEAEKLKEEADRVKAEEEKFMRVHNLEIEKEKEHEPEKELENKKEHENEPENEHDIDTELVKLISNITELPETIFDDLKDFNKYDRLCIFYDIRPCVFEKTSLIDAYKENKSRITDGGKKKLYQMLEKYGQAA